MLSCLILSRKVRSINDDLEQENRRARVFSLHNRGLTQSEIAQQVDVTQQTVSTDLKHIREASRKVIEDATRNATFEYAKYFEGMDQIKKDLWEIAVDSYANNNHNPDPHFNSLIRDRITALALLKECYKERLEAFVGGPISEMSATRHVKDSQPKESFDSMIRNDPSLRDFAKMNKGIMP